MPALFSWRPKPSLFAISRSPSSRTIPSVACGVTSMFTGNLVATTEGIKSGNVQDLIIAAVEPMSGSMPA